MPTPDTSDIIPVRLLRALSQPGAASLLPAPSCLDAADANDSGADAVATLGHLFASAGPLPAPRAPDARHVIEAASPKRPEQREPRAPPLVEYCARSA